MRCIIMIIAAIAILGGCVSQEAEVKKSAGFKSDSVITRDMDIPSDYIWMQTMDSDDDPKYFEIFRIDPSNPDSIKIYCHIMDSESNFVSGLVSREGYHICGFEDNNRVVDKHIIHEIRREKVDEYSISFVLDHSGSIGEVRARSIQSAFLNSLDTKLDNDRFSLVKFDEYVNTEVPLSADKSAIRSMFSANGLDGYGGYTSFYDGVIEGINSISSQKDKKIVIAISDGYDNASQNSSADVLKEAIDKNVSVFTVGFGPNIDESRMRYLAERTGGKYYHIYKTEEFAKVFEDIYTRINSYYRIIYKAITFGRHEVKLVLCKDKKELNATGVYYNDPIEDCDISMSLEVRGVRPDGTETYAPEFTIWESINREYHPLLPYIFFEENSSEIPSRYFRRTKAEITNNRKYEYIINNDKIEIYHDILNIIGERFHEYPNSTITLIGCNDGRKESISLSRERAQAVKQYLADVCQIPEDHIKIKSRALPENATQLATELGREENRRVEIETDEEKLLSPFVYSQTAYEVSPPKIKTYVNILQRDEIHSWKIDFEKDGKMIWSNQTFAEAPVKYIVYDIDNEVTYDTLKGKYIIEGMDQIFASLTVYKDSGQQVKCVSEKQKIQLVQNTIQKIERECLDARQMVSYNLILFGFNRSGFNNDILDRNLTELLKEYDQTVYIDIYGHTDIIGSAESNMNLSLRRARSVESHINTIARRNNENLNIRKADGYGEMILPQFFDNNYPEGRMYCRTARIRVLLPLKCD